MTTGRAVEPRLKGPGADAGDSRMPDDRLLGMFIDGGDEGAFEALVARHAPRVLGVCRQVLRRPHDVEDVFQATFLLLARNASRIRKRESLGHWLHGVAHRLAVRSKVKSARRGAVEAGGQGVAMAARQPDDDAEGRDLRRVVHEEVDRLPETLRQPVLLCYLEGMTNEDAARHLGCPSGTLKVRLARARELLHGRLLRRGVALPAALLLLALPASAPAAEVVPRRLIRSTVAAVMAAEARRRGGAPWRRPTGAVLPAALAALTSGAFATVVMYLLAPGRVGFFEWFLGAVRRTCH